MEPSKPPTHKGFKTTDEIIAGMAVLLIAIIGYGFFVMSDRSTTHDDALISTESSDSGMPASWETTPISWQNFKLKYWVDIPTPDSWIVECREGGYIDCRFQAPVDISAEKQNDDDCENNFESCMIEHAPYASLVLEIFPSKYSNRAYIKDLPDEKIGTMLFDKYEVFGFGDVYGFAHKGKVYQFDLLSLDKQFLSSVKFTN